MFKYQFKFPFLNIDIMPFVPFEFIVEGLARNNVTSSGFTRIR
jgi:hypothetical protein